MTGRFRLALSACRTSRATSIRRPNESSALHGNVSECGGIDYQPKHTGIGNSDSKKLVQDVADDFDRMVASLVTDRVPIE